MTDERRQTSGRRPYDDLRAAIYRELDELKKDFRRYLDEIKAHVEQEVKRGREGWEREIERLDGMLGQLEERLTAFARFEIEDSARTNERLVSRQQAAERRSEWRQRASIAVAVLGLLFGAAAKLGWI